MTYQFHPSNLLGVASGIAMAFLGLVVLVSVVRSTRRATGRSGVLAFSLFAILWGLQVAAANTSNLAADEASVLFWSYTNTALLIPLYLPLLLFLAQYPAAVHPVVRQPLGVFLASVPAIAGLFILWTEPGLFINGTDVNPHTGQVRASFGPLFRPLSAFSALGVFVIALWAAAARWRRAQADTVRDQMALIVAALLTFVSYKGTELLTYGLPGSTRFEELAQRGELLLAWSVVALALLTVIGVAILAAMRRHEAWSTLILTMALVPAAAGLIERFVIDLQAQGFNLVGLWRLLSVAFFTYAIAHYRLFDIDLHARSASAVAGYAALCVATGAGLFWWAADVLLDQWWLGGAAAVAIAALYAPTLRLRRPAHGVRGPPSNTGRVYRRRLEIYRAAIEEARARSADDRTDQHYLSVLRRNLGITSEEHRVLVALADRSPRMTAPQLEAGQVIGNRYKVGRAIADGSHGRVVLAADNVSGDPVVLKELQPHWRSSAEARKRLEREIHLMRSLDHPRLVKLLDAIRGATPILVLEHLPNGDLEQRMARGPLAVGECVAITRDVAAALDALHASGVVHRDVKPANILFGADDRAKLGDFGIALSVEPPGDWTSLTTAGTQPGTVAYMSPEQARGDPVTPQSDQYALAAVLYRMLANRPPVDLTGLSDVAARRTVDSTRPAFPIPHAPEALSAAVEHAMRPDPSERFQSAGAFARALDNLDGAWDDPVPDARGAHHPAPTEWAG